VSVAQLLAGGWKGRAGRLAEPECLREPTARHLAASVPSHPSRAKFDFRAIGDLVAETVHHHPSVRRRVCPKLARDDLIESGEQRLRDT
jgi:hypothetical protein